MVTSFQRQNQRDATKRLDLCLRKNLRETVVCGQESCSLGSVFHFFLWNRKMWIKIGLPVAVCRFIDSLGFCWWGTGFFLGGGGSHQNQQKGEKYSIPTLTHFPKVFVWLFSVFPSLYSCICCWQELFPHSNIFSYFVVRCSGRGRRMFHVKLDLQTLSFFLSLLVKLDVVEQKLFLRLSSIHCHWNVRNSFTHFVTDVLAALTFWWWKDSPPWFYSLHAVLSVG